MRIAIIMCFLLLGFIRQADAQTSGDSLPDRHNIELRLMLINATLDLNQAMLEGVQASIDTLNLVQDTIFQKETNNKEALLRLKRARDKALLMPYLLHVQDSLRHEVVLLKQEKTEVEKVLNAPGNIQPIVINSEIRTAGKDTLKLETSYNPEDQTKETVIKNLSTNETIVMKDNMKRSQKRKNRKQLAKYKNIFPLDTVIVYDIGTKLVPEPERQSQTTKNYASHPLDTATIARIIRDTSSTLVIRNPVTNDSIVIKPNERQNQRNKREEKAAKRADADSSNHTKAESFYKRALAEKDAKRAEEYLHKAIDLYPDYYDAWYSLAERAEQKGMETKAIDDYAKCSTIDSTIPLLFYKIGAIYMKTNRKEEALKNFDRAIQLNPHYIDALMGRAAIFTDKNKVNDAIKDYDKVTATDKTYFQAYKARGMAKMNNKQFDAAAIDFTLFLIFKPDDAESYYYRGVCRIGNKELEDGCLDLSTAADKGYPAAEKAFRKSCQ